MNRFMLATIGVIVAFGVISAAQAETEIYRWVDARGVVHFSQEGGSLPAQGSYEVFHLPKTESAPRPARFVVPIALDQGIPTVEVSINDTWEATFVLDTGASVTVVDRSLVESLGVTIPEDAPQRLLRTAQGTVKAVSIHLDSLAIGAARQEHVEVIVPMEGLVPNLLGQSFLSAYILTLDRSRRTVELKPI